MAAPGVVIYKTFTWRGNDEEWGNTYHFVGDPPSSPADWRSLVDDLIALEKTVLGQMVTIERAICYENTDDPSVYSYDLSAFAGNVPGTFTVGIGGVEAQEGGTAYMARWDTGRRSHGKAIYLRKYWHPGIFLNTDPPDQVAPGLKTAVGTFANNVLAASGDWPGLAGPDGVAPVGHLALPYITSRDLKKGRRRPT